jgi:hypothetical protein
MSKHQGKRIRLALQDSDEETENEIQITKKLASKSLFTSTRAFPSSKGIQASTSKVTLAPQSIPYLETAKSTSNVSVETKSSMIFHGVPILENLASEIAKQNAVQGKLSSQLVDVTQFEVAVNKIKEELDPMSSKYEYLKDLYVSLYEKANILLKYSDKLRSLKEAGSDIATRSKTDFTNYLSSSEVYFQNLFNEWKVEEIVQEGSNWGIFLRLFIAKENREVLQRYYTSHGLFFFNPEYVKSPSPEPLLDSEWLDAFANVLQLCHKWKTSDLYSSIYFSANFASFFRTFVETFIPVAFQGFNPYDVEQSPSSEPSSTPGYLELTPWFIELWKFSHVSSIDLSLQVSDVSPGVRDDIEFNRLITERSILPHYSSILSASFNVLSSKHIDLLRRDLDFFSVFEFPEHVMMPLHDAVAFQIERTLSSIELKSNELLVSQSTMQVEEKYAFTRMILDFDIDQFKQNCSILAEFMKSKVLRNKLNECITRINAIQQI